MYIYGGWLKSDPEGDAFRCSPALSLGSDVLREQKTCFTEKYGEEKRSVSGGGQLPMAVSPEG